MLVVQLTSTCDVCLDRYVWNSTTHATANANASAGPDENGNNANDHFMRPHVIACGHVFCYQCVFGYFSVGGGVVLNLNRGIVERIGH